MYITDGGFKLFYHLNLGVTNSAKIICFLVMLQILPRFAPNLTFTWPNFAPLFTNFIYSNSDKADIITNTTYMHEA